MGCPIFYRLNTLQKYNKRNNFTMDINNGLVDKRR